MSDPLARPRSQLDETRLHALLEAGRAVVAERELESVFDRLLQVARELTGARYAALGVLDDEREGLADFITAGLGAEAHEEIGDLPRGLGVLGLLISDPRPLRLANVGDHPRSYGFPAGHPRMQSFLGVPILIRGEVWGNLYLTDKRDGSFDESDEEAVVVLAAWAAIAVENARLYRESERGRERIARSLRALEATSEIARAVGGETQLERVLELIAKRSRALVEANGLIIVLAEDDGLRVAAAAGNVPKGVVGAVLPAEGSVAGRVVLTGKAERTSAGSGSQVSALGELGVEASAGLFVPLTFRQRHVGVLEAFDRHEGPDFDDEDERILAAAAASAATAVATAQTVERDLLRRTLRAAEDERRRWARELHDETLQALGGLLVLLSSIRPSDEVARLHEAMDDAGDRIRREVHNLRQLITELRPGALDELGLGPALESLIDRARTVHSAEIDIRVELGLESGRGTHRHDPELETVVYRVVQEAVNNACRHAAAGAIRIEVIENERELIVAVRDDGVGFDQSRASGGFGLAGMRERVALVGGALTIASSDSGTSVEAILPLAGTARPAARQR